jgi:phosphomethylpyrimidine synthase
MKSMTSDKPFYMLGPLVTDIAPGYDHIVTAIGGAISSSCGADFLCYVTPAEHLALPNEEDVYEGVMASRIAAHVGDMIKYGDRARAWDLDMARARREGRAREIRNSRLPEDTEACTMCGDFCALKIVKENFNFDR